MPVPHSSKCCYRGLSIGGGSSIALALRAPRTPPPTRSRAAQRLPQVASRCARSRRSARRATRDYRSRPRVHRPPVAQRRAATRRARSREARRFEHSRMSPTRLAAAKITESSAASCCTFSTCHASTAWVCRSHWASEGGSYASTHTATDDGVPVISAQAATFGWSRRRAAYRRHAAMSSASKYG